MTRSVEELAQTARLDDYYQQARSPILQDITNRVCGCGYVGTSYATRSEADLIVSSLALKPGEDLLDLGAGAGWPGLYLAKLSGCRVTLLDIPVCLTVTSTKTVLSCERGARAPRRLLRKYSSVRVYI